jgi:signal transduction histidine kinase/CheY-like chemotaxis protein
MFRSLKVKLFLLISLILLVTVGVFLMVTSWFVESNQQDTLLNSFDRTQSVVDTLIETQRFNLFKQTNFIGGNESLFNSVKDSSVLGPDEITQPLSDNFNEVVEHLRQQLLLPVFDVVSIEGVLLASTYDMDELHPLSEGGYDEGSQYATIAADALEGFPGTSLILLDGKLALISGAPLGDPDAPVGAVILGKFLDDGFASQISRLTHTNVSFLSDDKIIGTSLEESGKHSLMDNLKEMNRELKSGGAIPDLVTKSLIIRLNYLTDLFGSPIGQIALGFSLEQSNKFLETIRNTLGAIGLILLLFSSILGFLLATRIVGPIKQIANRFRLLAEGETMETIKVELKDEVGQLTHSFNDMIKSLDKKETELKRKANESAALYEIAHEITAQVTLQPTLDLIVDQARNLLHAEVGYLALQDSDNSQFPVRAMSHSGNPDSSLDSVGFDLGEGLLGEVIATGEGLVVGNLMDDEQVITPLAEFSGDKRLRSAVVVPLKRQGKSCGVLSVGSIVKDQYGSEDKEFLNSLAVQAAVGIESAELYEKVRMQSTVLEKTVEERTEELKQTNLQLEEASTHKSAFLANMSHELRTPMNAIIGYSEMLLEDAEDDGQEESIPDLQKIQSAGKHLLSLINDILDLSKIEAGKIDLYLETFGINQLVIDVANTAEPLAAKTDSKLVVNCPQNMGNMRSDLTKIRQTLFNLLSNACKFTQNGTVTLEVGQDDEDGEQVIVFSVQDTGIGMTEEQASKVFGAFTQADSSTTKEFGGTGLGLAITKEFCEILGGGIEVSSEPGAGSCFTMRMPRTSKDATESEEDISTLDEDSAAVSPESLENAADAIDKTILVVDDDPVIRDLMTRYLLRGGYTVKTAVNGTEALRLTRELKPDAITLDVMMPEMDGWEVLAEIKNDPDLADIPVIMATIKDDRNIGFSLGAADYLVKPVNSTQLHSVLLKNFSDATEHSAMIVDDDGAMRELMCRMLQSENWKVDQAENGRIGLELLEKLNVLPDVIFLDLMMPEMDGFEFLEHVRENPRTKDIKVIVVTAKTLTKEERKTLSGSADQLVNKWDKNLEDLIDTLSNVLPAKEIVEVKDNNN